MSEPRHPSAEDHTKHGIAYLQTIPTTDEVSLVDIWLTLVKRKFVIASVFVLSLLVGLLVAMTRSDTYAYTLALEIGSTQIGERSTPIESTETVETKFRSLYIPTTLNQIWRSNPESGRKKISVSSPKNSSLIILTTKGTETEEKFIVETLLEVGQRIFDDHRAKTDAYRSVFLAELTKAQLELRVSEANLPLVDRSQYLNATQTSNSDSILKTAPSDLSKFEYQISEVARRQTEAAISLQKAKIAEIELKLNNVRDTKFVTEPVRSLTPAGPGKILILMISVVLGLVLGVIFAFVAEFGTKVRVHQKLVSEK